MAIEFKLPELGENITTATISKILVKVGDRVTPNQPVLEVETDKAVAEIPCATGGVVTDIKVREGQAISPGAIVFLLSAETGAAQSTAAPALPAPPTAAGPEKTAVPAAPAATPAKPVQPSSTRPANAPVMASPSVRRLAREMGVNPADVPPSDPSGRLTVQDVMRFVETKSSPAGASAETQEAPRMTAGEAEMEGGADKWGPVLYDSMNAIRRKTAEHMEASWRIPHVTHFDKADITDLEVYRLKLSKKAEKEGARLNTICFVLKVVAEALQRFPKFNAALDLDNARVILKKYCHIGVAVDTPAGLLVPVLRDVDRKSVFQLAQELPEIAEKARARKLALEDMQGGTFTISNLGGLGGTGFTPIINAPQVAILGMSRASVEPAYIDGAFQPRTMLPLSLSYDHRLIDGADAARFVRWIAESLENPWRMFTGQ